MNLALELDAAAEEDVGDFSRCRSGSWSRAWALRGDLGGCYTFRSSQRVMVWARSVIFRLLALLRGLLEFCPALGIFP